MALRPSFSPNQIEIVETFIRDTFRQTEKAVAVVGMSGGLDSSVTATLCAKALGPERVLGLIMRDEITRDDDVRDAKEVAKGLGIAVEVIDIQPMVQAFRDAMGIEDPKALGNVRARCRMIAAYEMSYRRDGLVVGTGNKSEILVGYFTKNGDGGVDLLPLGDLYKTQVREMARVLGIRPRVIDKTPSAGLWEGQTDEAELGITYDELDRILLGIELGMSSDEISRRTGLPASKVSMVHEMVRRSVHKRRLPLIPKVGIRTVGLDWRE